MDRQTIAVTAGGVAVLALAALLFFFFLRSNIPAFTEAVHRAEGVVLYEGLPHQTFESELLEKERLTKAVQELNGYTFYQEPLVLAGDTSMRLADVLGDPETYTRSWTDKVCGGFHPDFAVKWEAGTESYWALICFGCHEAWLFGPEFESRHDLNNAAYEELREILKGYRKNRPGAFKF